MSATHLHADEAASQQVEWLGHEGRQLLVERRVCKKKDGLFGMSHEFTCKPHPEINSTSRDEGADGEGKGLKAGAMRTNPNVPTCSQLIAAIACTQQAPSCQGCIIHAQAGLLDGHWHDALRWCLRSHDEASPQRL